MYDMCTHLNRLTVVILMRTYNIPLFINKKDIPELSRIAFWLGVTIYV